MSPAETYILFVALGFSIGFCIGDTIGYFSGAKAASDGIKKSIAAHKSNLSG